MKEFFKSFLFKIIVAVTVLVVTITVIYSALGGWASPQSDAVGAAVNPLQRLTRSISDGIGGFFAAFSEHDRLMAENEQLKEEIANLTREKLDYQEALNQNEFYEQFLEIKEENSDFEFQPASAIARDPSDPYGSFTIDAGSLQGLSPHDPVITAQGLIGYVTAVAPTYSVVVTLFDPAVKAGAYDRRTEDKGIISCTANDVASGVCRLVNLPRDCSVAIGDLIVTGGGGVFPKGLVIGTVESIEQSPTDVTAFAIVRPSADLSGNSKVMVITSFAGQSTIGQADRP